jgi:hypothetical protein
LAVTEQLIKSRISGSVVSLIIADFPEMNRPAERHAVNVFDLRLCSLAARVVAGIQRCETVAVAM